MLYLVFGMTDLEDIYFIRQINISFSKWYLVPLVILWVSLGVYWKDVPVDMRFSMGVVSCSMVIGSISAFLFLFKVAKLICKTTFFDLFSFCGTKSLYIYLFHFPLFFVISKLFFDINIDSCVVDEIYWWVYVLLILIPTILFYIFSRRKVVC